MSKRHEPELGRSNERACGTFPSLCVEGAPRNVNVPENNLAVEHHFDFTPFFFMYGGVWWTNKCFDVLACWRTLSVCDQVCQGVLDISKKFV